MNRPNRCPSFEVMFTTQSEREVLLLHRSGRPEVKRLPELIDLLAQGPVPDAHAKPLLGHESTYRYRLGRLRVVYVVELDSCRITLLKVALRDEQTYRK